MISFCFLDKFGLIAFLDDATKKLVGNIEEINESANNLINFLLNKRIFIYYSNLMKTIFLFFLTIYIAYYLFRPVTKKEIKKFNDPDNWSNMGF
jgi:hypothetical protein